MTEGKLLPFKRYSITSEVIIRERDGLVRAETAMFPYSLYIEGDYIDFFRTYDEAAAMAQRLTMGDLSVNDPGYKRCD